MLFSLQRNKVRRCCSWDSLGLITTGLSEGNYLEFLATETLRAASVRAWGETSEHHYTALLLMSLCACHVFYILIVNLPLSSTVSKDGCGFITDAIPAIKNITFKFFITWPHNYSLSPVRVGWFWTLVDYGWPAGFKLLAFSLAEV